MGNARPPISFQLLGTNVRLGAGTAKEVGETFQAASGKKVLIVTDSGVVKAGLLHSRGLDRHSRIIEIPFGSKGG